jgi:hypothetical protein
MKKETKKQLEAVINSIVNEDSEGATTSFHDYLRAKTQTILLGEKEEECDEEDMDDDDDKDDDDKKTSDSKEKDDEDEDEKPAKGKKGVNPFIKKSKKDKDDE